MLQSSSFGSHDCLTHTRLGRKGPRPLSAFDKDPFVAKVVEYS